MTTTPGNLDTQKSLILWTIWMVALTAIILWCAYLVRDVLLLLYIAGLFAIGFSPIVRLIEKQKLLPIGTRRFPRWMAILVLYLFIIGALTGIGFMVVPPLVDQAKELWASRNEYFERAQNYLISKGLLREHFTFWEALQGTPVGQGKEAAGTVFGAFLGVLGGIFGIVTILILTFYLLVDAARLRDSFIKLFPPSRRRRIDAAARDVTVKVSAWLGGQLFLGTVIGVTSAIGLWLLGIPYFYVLALISAVGEMIPVIGPILSAIPAIAVAATVSPQKVLFVIIFFIVQQQFENHILVPKVMERQVGVSAVTVIVALLIGGKLFGILGALLAVPTAAILQVVFNEITSTGDSRRA